MYYFIKQHTKFMVVCLALITFSNIIFATQDSTELFASKWQSIRSMRAEFTQTITNHHKRVGLEHGQMMLQRPGKFRWETKTPISQLLIADGNNVWIYDRDLEQVTVRSQAQAMRGTPALFLSSSKQVILNDYKIDFNRSKNQEIYDLFPKSKRSSFTSMRFIFKGQQLVSIVLNDQLGQSTQVVFANIQQDKPINAKLFKFSPPKGVDVIRES